MRLTHGLHLAYCTNVHRGQTWPETFSALQQYTLAVRRAVCPTGSYAIGLRLSDSASRQLSDPNTLLEFQRWLERENCYVFTINGFPYGNFHGTRVKEQVYAPDWTTPERLAYTQRLFRILAEILPQGIEGSVSTVPCSFKSFIHNDAQVAAMRAHLWQCVEFLDALETRSGKLLHLGLEPEPLCYLETTPETVAFLEQMRSDRPGDERLSRYLGVNYDACHLAVEFEEARTGFDLLRQHEIRISKIHLSSALQVVPNRETLKALRAFADDTYLHQVVERCADGTLRRHRDLPDLLERSAGDESPGQLPDWRIHFHIPLHARSTAVFQNTTDHLLEVLNLLGQNPGLCSHLEMETYTWEVMPAALKQRDVVDQLIGEYEWTLAQLSQRGLRTLA